MIVRCAMAQCPYHDNRGFCAKKGVVSIDGMGMCSVLWKNGQQRFLDNPLTIERYPREELMIVDVAASEISGVIEPKEGEEGDSRLENPQNGDPA